jgi:hypothetical protein
MKTELKLMLVILFTVIAYLAISYFSEKNKYPVSYKVCGLNYQDCEIVAKFKNRYNCERTNQMDGWYCDETDKNHIVCQEKASDISSGYCD